MRYPHITRGGGPEDHTGGGPKDHVNTDAEKVEFIRWFIEAVQGDAFDDAG